MKYNNENIQITKMEKELYSQYQTYKGDTVEEKTSLILKALKNVIDEDPQYSISIANAKSNEDKLELVMEKLIKETNNFDFDFRYFWPYNPGNGFSVQVDALFRPDKRGFFFVVYCMNPPGAFYTSSQKEDIHLVSFIDFSKSNQHIIHFKEGARSHNQIPYEENGHLIFSIKYVTFDKKHRPKIQDYGFSILPLFFEDKFVFSGNYQIPIFKGELDKTAVQALVKKEPMEMLLDIADKKTATVAGSKLKFASNSSLIVRLKDNQLDGVFSRALDNKNMDFRLLPRHKIDSFAYNAEFQKKLYKKVKPKSFNDLFIPKISEEEMNIVVKETVKEAFSLV